MGNLENLTVCIPVYNEKNRIWEAVDSVARQGVRVLVSDNCSMDGTVEVCREIERQYSNVSCFYRDRNYGSLRNAQSLLTKVETDFVMFLGSHDRLDDSYCGTVLKEFSLDPDLVVVSGELHLDSEVGDLTERYVKWTGGMAPRRCDRVRSFLFTSAPAVWLTYGIFRTDILRSCIREGLSHYGVDVFLLVRALMAGKARIIRGVVYYAHVREAGNTGDYLERITGKRPNKKEVAVMRRVFKSMKYKCLVDACCYGVGRAFFYRYLFMVRSGFFLMNNSDVSGWLLFVPVKLSRLFRLQNFIFKSH